MDTEEALVLVATILTVVIGTAMASGGVAALAFPSPRDPKPHEDPEA